MKMSENKFFLEKPTWKFSTGALPMVAASEEEILIYNSFISNELA